MAGCFSAPESVSKIAFDGHFSRWDTFPFFATKAVPCSLPSFLYTYHTPADDYDYYTLV